MDLVLNGRGTRITDRVREVAEHKLGRLERMEPRVTRLQIEIISEKNPRLGGAHRVEASFDALYETASGLLDAIMGVLGKNSPEAKVLQRLRSRMRVPGDQSEVGLPVEPVTRAEQ